MKETLKHKEAFEYYYSLGDSRGLREVAQKFNVSLTSLAKWSVAFEWQNKVSDRDEEIINALEKKLKNEIIKDKMHFYNLIRKGMQIYQNNLIAGKVKVNNVSDFEKLLNSALKMGVDTSDIISGEIIVKLDDD